MSELNALAQKLSALITKDVVFDAGARVISQGGSPDPITAILDEINDTVLERNLEISAGSETIQLVAAGRRLRGIYSTTADTSTDVVGKVISREDPDLVKDASLVLSQICADADRLTVRSLMPQPFGKGEERGISVRELSALWQAERDETPKTPMERFLASNAKGVKSVMHVSKGEIASTSGDFKALQAIWNNQVLEFRKKNKKVLNGEDGPQLVCLEGVLEDGTAAALVVVDSDIALMAYQPEHFGAMHKSWQSIFG